MKKRLKALQRALARNGYTNIYVTNLKNIHYLTGMKMSVGILFVEKNAAYLFADDRYRETARRIVPQAITVLDSSEIVSAIRRHKTLVVESVSMTLSEQTRLRKKFKNKKIVHSIDLIEGLRRLKDYNEIRRIRIASRITKSVLRMVPSFLRLGVTERSIAAKIQAACLMRGADGMAFDTIVAFGKNTSLPHHSPTDTRLKAGDLVQVDMGAMVSSYCSDFSRVYVFGKMNREHRKTYAALKQAKKSAEKLLGKGVSTHLLDRVARGILKKHGIEKNFCHALGHGLGMDIHEGVVLSSKRKNERLRSGEVVTIEPGVYFPGKYGMRLEDTHVIG